MNKIRTTQICPNENVFAPLHSIQRFLSHFYIEPWIWSYRGSQKWIPVYFGYLSSSPSSLRLCQSNNHFTQILLIPSFVCMPQMRHVCSVGCRCIHSTHSAVISFDFNDIVRSSVLSVASNRSPCETSILCNNGFYRKIGEQNIRKWFVKEFFILQLTANFDDEILAIK